jgi:hypothetical protein
MFLPLDVDVTILTNEAKVMVLVSQRPPSYTNDTLRTTYPSLLQQPSFILKEFLDSNEMALCLYGVTLASDTYGMLRLKLMGCLVAIIQDFCAVENVDSMLSRSDISYIAHVGGVLISPQRRFSSDIFIVFDFVDVVNQLAGLFDSKMPVLISPPPRQLRTLSSAAGWNSKFKSKLPDDAVIDQTARTLRLSISAVVLESPPFGTVRPQFVRPPRHDEAMVQHASSSDPLYELSTILCVGPFRLAHHDRTLPRQRDIRLQRYSIFHHLNKEHDSVQSTLNMMNGVNILSPLPILCGSNKESLIGTLSAV